MRSEGEYRVEHVEQTPSGYRVATIPSGEHWVRLAFPPGSRRRGSGRVIEILHPRGENPTCKLNPLELVILGNPLSPKSAREQLEAARREWERAKESLAEARTRSARRRAAEDVEFWGNKMAFLSSAKANPAGELDQAVKLYQEFHGKDPKGVIEAQRSAAMRLDYTCLGKLLALGLYAEGVKIPSPDHWDEYPHLRFDEEVKLASNAGGAQLYAIGGNQDVSEVLAKLPDVDATKDLADLGELAFVVYEARKAPSFEVVEWMHTFDEPRPRLGFDQVKHELFFVGGRYEVNAPGIEH